MGFFTLISNGVVKSFAPDLYKQISEVDVNSHADAMKIIEILVNSDSLALQIANHIGLFGFGVLFIWSIIAWGAYRELNGLSRWRSLAALVISGVLEIPSLAVLIVIAVSIS